MPDAPKHPVTVLGDLLTIGPDRIRRPATIADLKSACRGLGWLVVEKVDGEWPVWAIDVLMSEEIVFEPGMVIDALAEAQPFPPAGGVS